MICSQPQENVMANAELTASCSCGIETSKALFAYEFVSRKTLWQTPN
jgi:hypothetical protein